MAELLDFADVHLSKIKGISREEMRSIESRAYMHGRTPLELMNRAGKGCAEYLLSNYPKGKTTVLISSSNNGGDGIVLSKELLEVGWDINVVQLSLKPVRSKESKAVLKELEDTNSANLFQVIPPGVLEENFESPNSESWKLIDISKFSKLLHESDLIIDSIFGINIRSQLRSPYDTYISVLNHLAPPDSDPICKVISVDIPSGLDCNTGEWHGPQFRPELVLTMQYSKRALEKLEIPYKTIDIGIESPSNYKTDGILYTQFFGKRGLETHKGDNGRLMVIGGSDEYTGAPILSTRAALRMGVDTVRTVVPESIRDIVAGYSENFLITKIKGNYITTKSVKYLYDLAMRRHGTVVIGMGISNKQEVWKFVREFVKKVKSDLQLVLDADGLRSFRDNNELLYNTHAILTPHRAELRYFLNEEVPTNPLEIVSFLEEKAKKLQCVIVLKGRIDIITNGYRTFLNYTGHPGMTVGGTGDVLAGVIASVTCFVRDPFFAAAIGAYIMGKAGEKAAEKYGNSLLATDIILELPKVLMELEELRDKVEQNFS